jgi:hypothetical protein
MLAKNRKPLILRDFSDVSGQIETATAARDFLGRTHASGKLKAIEIARLLGWIRPRRTESVLAMKQVAKACDNALTLIEPFEIDDSHAALTDAALAAARSGIPQAPMWSLSGAVRQTIAAWMGSLGGSDRLVRRWASAHT